MSFLYANRVHETSTTSGSGTYDLDGAEAGMQGFVAGIGDGNKTAYLASRGNDWEVGIGTVTSDVPSTLSRDTILDSSDGGAAIDWATADAKDIVCTIPAEAFDRHSVQKAGSFSASENDGRVLYECIGSSGQIVATLPDGALAKSGFPVSVVNSGSGTLTVSIRGNGYPTGDKVNGLAAGFELLNPGQSATLRLLDSEDNWQTVSDGNLFIGDILASAVERTILRTSGDGDGVIEGASMDLGSGVLARAATPGTAFTDANEPEWLITVGGSTFITVKNTTGVTVELFTLRNTSPFSSGSRAHNASFDINSLGTDYYFFFQAGNVTTKQTIRIDGFVSATNFHINWQIGRG